LQVVHDVAPGAGLAFATAGLSQTEFADRILALARAGADVIVDDVTFPAEPMFQDGPAARAVDQVAAVGVAYFSAAGNLGRAGYESAFRESGVDLGADGLNWVPGQPHFYAHDFDPGPGTDLFQAVTLPPGDTTISFQWADPYFSVSGGSGARTDLDLAVFDMGGNLLATVGGFTRNEGGDPVEVFTIPNTTGGPLRVQLAIGRAAGPTPVRVKYVAFRSDFAPDEYAADAGGTVFGHANAAGAIAVGAGSYDQSPAFGRSPTPEPSSSAGGTAVLIDADGAPITPDPRPGPAVIAPDGVDTSFFGAADGVGSGPYEANGRPNFFGTSAAAPHAAGVAALMLQANRGLTAAGVRAALESTAIDAGTPGRDDQSGAGLIQATAAVYAVGGPYTVYLDGTDGDDALRVRRSPFGMVELVLGLTALFAIPDGEAYAVQVTGGAGADTLTVDSIGGLSPEGGVRFDGGDGADAATLLGTGADDAFTYTPDGDDAGRLDRAGGGFVTTLVMAAVEAAFADGLTNGTDALIAYAGDATVVLDRMFGYGTVLPAGGLPLTYRAIDRPTVVGGTVAVPGTAGADEVGVTAAGLVTLTNFDGYLNAVTVAARELGLETWSGGDRITVAGNHPYSGGVVLDGGSAAGVPYGMGGDALVFNGSGASVSLDPSGGSVGEAGSGSVRYTNIETFLPNFGGGDAVIRAGSGGVVVTPISATAAVVTTAAGTMTLTASSGTLLIDGGDGEADSVTVRLPTGAAGAEVSADGVVEIDGYVAVAVTAAVELLAVEGNARDNAFTVSPGAVAVEVDGGAGSDRLSVPGAYPGRPLVGSGVVPSDRPVAYRSMEGVVLGQTPAPADDEATTPEDTAVAIDVLGNDGGLADGGLSVVITSPPRLGTAAVVGGKVVYTPSPDSNDDAAGADGFAYRVEDANGDGGEARVTVRVRPVNDPPRAFPVSAEVAENGSVLVTLAGADGDPEWIEALRYALVSSPAHGTLSGFDPAAGWVLYTPAPGYSGTDGFEFGVTDAGGEARARVSIAVRPVADEPHDAGGGVRAGGIIVTGAGAGGGPHVRVFDAATGEGRFSFFAYDPSYTGGVRVAVGDVNADGTPDIITGTGPGGAAHVQVFSGVDLALLASFYAYAPSFVGGVSLAAGDLDGLPGDEVVVGAGPGAGPHVQAFKIADGRAVLMAGPLGSFYAFDPSFQGGANVAVADLDGLPGDEVVVGAAAGGGPHVKVFDPRTGDTRLSFFAFEDDGRLGVSVAAADLDGDGKAEILTGPGDGGGPVVRVFTGGTAELAREVPAFDPEFRGGVWLGVVDRDADGSAEVLVAPGRDSRSLQLFDGPSLDLLDYLDAYGGSFPGGVFVAGSTGSGTGRGTSAG
ncbi:MAG: S8 family serine peptidase, partial [Gemmataceae bacterium]|nr:S8 family serine peptidase [Gemmataceae bacterium]